MLIFLLSIALITVGLSIGQNISNTTESIVSTATNDNKRFRLCCTAQRPCQSIYWPLSLEKGFHRPITADRYGRSISSIFRSRFDQRHNDDQDDDNDQDGCHLTIEKTSRGEIRYRLPSIISNLTTTNLEFFPSKNRKNKKHGRLNVSTFRTSLDYYRFLLRKLSPPIDSSSSNIDLAFIDFYSDHDDLADLLSRIIESDSSWFRIEFELETARYNLSIGDDQRSIDQSIGKRSLDQSSDQRSIADDRIKKKSILNNRFVSMFNRKFTFLLNESEESIQKLWYELFAEFGTHYHQRGRLGGVYAFYGKIDCDQSWANAFDTLDDFARCIRYLIRSDDTSNNMTRQQTELCQNVTSRTPIHGRVEIAGGNDLSKNRLLSESHLSPSFDRSLLIDWTKTIRQSPSLIASSLKPICSLVRYIFEIDFEKNPTAAGASAAVDHVSMSKKIDTYIDSCTSALSSYTSSSRSFTGQIISDDDDDKIKTESKESESENRDKTDNRFLYQFKNQCSPRQQNSRLSIDIRDTDQEPMVIAVRYDNNDSVCVTMKKKSSSMEKYEKSNFQLCSETKLDESAAVAAALAGSAVGNMSALNLGVIIIVVTMGTILAIFGVLRTLPAF